LQEKILKNNFIEGGEIREERIKRQSGSIFKKDQQQGLKKEVA